jgi:orotate phosphoribosyltransferase
METASKIARHLLQINAIKLSPQNPFTWSSGILSPIYCDNRIALGYPSIRTEIKKGLVELAREISNVGGIAGVATAGIPHGALVADEMELPFAYVRSSPKSHGRQNLIEGVLPKENRVILIEDLISTGGSSLAAVKALRDSGYEVAAVLAIFDYGFPQAAQAFENAGCPYFSLSNFEVLIHEAIDSGYILPSDLELLRQWQAETIISA